MIIIQTDSYSINGRWVVSQVYDGENFRKKHKSFKNLKNELKFIPRPTM